MEKRSKRRFLLRLVAAIACIISSAEKVALADTTTTTTTDIGVEEEASPDSSTIQVVGDDIEDSFFDPLQSDPSCTDNEDCNSPPASTIETETRLDATCFKGGDDSSEDSKNLSDGSEGQCTAEETVDKHWGNDQDVLTMRDQLIAQARDAPNDKRPPIFLMPGLASTRLVAWKLKKCPGMFQGDIKVQDNVWLNINLVIQMGAVNVQCMSECLSLGVNQSDSSNWDNGCKLRPDEGLDAIASLAPGGIGSNLLVGGTNTVYAWLIQWLADNLGYDVTNIIGLPYDWRLSPDKMESRDGFLSMTRRRIEAAVATNGKPGIMVAHSMGNLVFRYFLNWLRLEMRDEAYQEYVTRARRRAQSMKKAEKQRQHKKQQQQQQAQQSKQAAGQTTPADEDTLSSYLPGWMTGVVSGLDEWYDWLTFEEDGENDVRKESNEESEALNEQLWELAVEEGDAKWLEWVERHIWTYIGLSAPMLGAVNPMRSVISGENMGLPITDEVARYIELTFGSTHTVNAVSTSTGFCDEAEPPTKDRRMRDDKDGSLACLDDVTADIELSGVNRDPWKDFPALRTLVRDRTDWNSSKPMIDIVIEECKTSAKKECIETDYIRIGPKDIESAEIFNTFNELWNEEGSPLITKREQLEESFLNSRVPNMLNKTWERPLIKHVIMAYGVDISTEVGYIYKKTTVQEVQKDELSKENKTDGLPSLQAVFWEEPGGELAVESYDANRGSLAEHFIRKKTKKQPYKEQTQKQPHSGDGSVPYLSLAWAHTWLLHASRARKYQEGTAEPESDRKSALDHISISHRPNGAIEWVEGPPPEDIDIIDPAKLVDTADTGVDHPHGTRYKPLMTRYHNIGTSRKTGIEYTTTVIEAHGVEHKETTRNYDILAAVFTDALKYMHEDL